jgi:BirA family transcriptional regulator, biotin operon repressor / biotin---[acetyl-CoA-carboxylase] ligase
LILRLKRSSSIINIFEPNRFILKRFPTSIFVKNTNSLRCENLIGEPFIELSEVDSSNNYAMRQVQAHLAVHGSTWFAHYQNAGKGQRGKIWNASPSENIMMSVVLDTSAISIGNQFVLNFAASLACFDLFNKYAIDKTCIKWPNDIYWGDRKAGGVLIENVLSGEKWKFSVVGIGININQTLFPEGLKNPVSLKQITGNTFDVIHLAKELCYYLNLRWKQLIEKKYKMLLDEYQAQLYKKNEITTFRNGSSLFTASVKGISEKGELIVEENGVLKLYTSIEWIIS